VIHFEEYGCQSILITQDHRGEFCFEALIHFTGNHCASVNHFRPREGSLLYAKIPVYYFYDLLVLLPMVEVKQRR
jgi:hypothetical protein